MNIARRIPLLGLALFMTAAACGGGSGKVAATVEGDPIPISKVEKLADGWLAAPQMQDPAMQQALPPDRVRRMALTSLVRMSYLEKLAKRYGITPPKDGVGQAAASAIPSEELRNVGFGSGGFQDAVAAGQLSRLVAEKVFPTVTVPAEKVRNYFTEHPELFGASWEASAQLAFFRDEGPAQQFASSARPGTDFVASARRAGAAEATDVESVTPDKGLPDVLIERVKTTAAGTVAAPLKVATGFWIVAVTTRNDVPAQTLDAARSSIEKHLIDQQRQELFDNWLDKQVKAAKITVAKRYGSWPFDA